MSTHHSHDHATSLGSIRLAFWLNAIFTCLQLIGGLWTGSVAILSEATHDLGDTLALGLAWRFERLSTRRADRRYSFGYRRFSVLSGYTSAVILVCFAVFILFEAVPKLFAPTSVEPVKMIYFALAGVAFNGVAVWRTWRGRNWNERVITLHLLEDLLGWLAVLLVGVVIRFTGWFFLDPLASVLIAGFVLYHAVSMGREVGKILLNAAPEHFDRVQILSAVLELPEVEDVHDEHFYLFDEHTLHATLHIRVRELKPGLVHTVDELLRRHGVTHSVIQLELPNDPCNYLRAHH